MDDTTVEVTVGTVETIITTAKVSVVTKSSGKKEVHLYVSPKSGRRTGEYLMLNVDQFEQLKQLVAAADVKLKT